MKTYTLDFTNVRTYWAFYEELERGFAFPNWFGKNMDAVWDLLTGYIEDKALVVIHGFSALPDDLEPLKNSFLKTLSEASHVYQYTAYTIRIES